MSATALRGLAVQAIDLGYRAEAVQLGEACVRYGRHLENPRAVAYYEATLANAAAQDNDRRTATRHLAFSETAISRSPAESGESWAAHYSPGRWAHESGMILSRLGDLDAAEEHLHLALEIHGLDRRRTRAIVLADLGGVRLRQGDMDGALTTWNEFIDCADGIRSVKVADAIEDMRLRLNRFHGTAEELGHKADQLTADSRQSQSGPGCGSHATDAQSGQAHGDRGFDALGSGAARRWLENRAMDLGFGGLDQKQRGQGRVGGA